jgi:hypothetical protein
MAGFFIYKHFDQSSRNMCFLTRLTCLAAPVLNFINHSATRRTSNELKFCRQGRPQSFVSRQGATIASVMFAMPSTQKRKQIILQSNNYTNFSP